MNTDLPPRNTYIKFRLKGESHFTAGKTSKQQPKPKSRHRGYVNFQPENTEQEEYSVEWKKVEEWYVEDEGEKEGTKADERDNNSDESKKTEESSDSHEKSELEKGNKHDFKNNTYRDSNSPSSTSNEEDYLSEFNRELPSYQPVTNRSSPYSSSEYSTAPVMDDDYETSMSQDMIRLRISQENTQKRKRTPLRDKVRNLKEQLSEERERNENLETIITKITEDDQTKLKQEIANMQKILDIYKKDMGKMLRKESEIEKKTSGWVSDTEIHEKTRNQVHNTKSHILSINSALNRKFDQLQKEYNELEKANEELKSELQIEKEHHRRYAIRELSLINTEEDSPEKIKYEAEMKLQEKQEEVEEMNRKYEEVKYQMNERIKELNQYSKMNNELYMENHQLKAHQIKDQTIIDKNDQIISLLKDKIKFNQYQVSKIQGKSSWSTHPQKNKASNPNLESTDSSSNENLTELFNSRKLQVRQGLPNKFNKTCYIISVMHSLAATIPTEKLHNTSNLNKLINETRKCMEGYKTREEAEQIMDEIWEYTISNFPEYVDNEGRIRHEDASEYLRRMIENEKELKDLTEIYIKLTMKCHNNQCEVLKSESRRVSNLIHPEFNESEENKEYNIQGILDKYMSENEKKPCQFCNQECEITKEIQIAPPTIIIDIPKVRSQEVKGKSLVKDASETMKIALNEKEIEYKVAGVIIHKGEETETGHYVMNRYNHTKQRWEQFDDHQILLGENFEKSNEEGMIYILNKVKTKADSLQKSNHQLQRNREIEKSSYSSMVKRTSRSPLNDERYSSQPKSNNELRAKEQRPKYSSQPKQQYIDEEREHENIRKKKNNIIIRGLPESNKENDVKAVINLNRAIGNEDFSNKNILNIIRLGENNEKERPLKVELDSFVTKLKIMRNAKYLLEKPEYNTISIQHDLTKMQMIEYKRLIQQSIEQEEKDREGNFKFRVRGPPGQWKIVKIPKNFQE